MKLKIVNGIVVTRMGRYAADIVSRDGKIKRITDPGRGGPCDEQLDAAGMHVFPGFIDAHVHSRDPGMTHKEDFAHVTAAAAAGGVTTIFDMPNAVPPVTDASTYHDRVAHHEQSAVVDFGLWGLSLGNENLAEIAGLIEAGAVGIKLFWPYSFHRVTRQLVYNPRGEEATDLIPPPTNREVYELCRLCSATDGLVAAHCEDRGVLDAAHEALGHPISSYDDLLKCRPDAAEASAVAVASEFARGTGCRFHVLHVSSGRAVDIIHRAQSDRTRISAETCPQYLTLTNEDFDRIGPIMKVYPPIRQASDRARLWRALLEGTITSVVSDHAPHTIDEKHQDLSQQPAGVVGVETIAAVMINESARGKITPELLSFVLSEGTARIYGLYPNKGAIQPGSDCDLTLVDLNSTTIVRNEALKSKNPLSLWNGQTLSGHIHATVVRGSVVMRNGEITGELHGRVVKPVRSGGAKSS